VTYFPCLDSPFLFPDQAARAVRAVRAVEAVFLFPYLVVKPIGKQGPDSSQAGDALCSVDPAVPAEAWVAASKHGF